MKHKMRKRMRRPQHFQILHVRAQEIKKWKNQIATHTEQVQQEGHSPFSQKIVFSGITAHNTGPDQIKVFSIETCGLDVAVPEPHQNQINQCPILSIDSTV